MIRSLFEKASTKLLKEFLSSEQAGGIILVVCTLIALTVANSGLGEAYHAMLHYKVGGLHIEEWVNDGLMTLFFLLVGLELEREIYLGELRTFRRALLPVVAAAGGMCVPAAIHLFLNHGTEFQSGAGIPTATDIAFSLGLLSLVASRVPFQLKVFLTAVAIADDLGAVVLIAVAYSNDLSLSYLSAAAIMFLGLCLANRLRVDSIAFYLIAGIFLWAFMLQSGIHATITGVLLSFAIPFRDGGEASPSYRLQHYLHKPVAYIVLPTFALCNTGIKIPTEWLAALTTNNSLGIILGLSLGKPIGISGVSYLLVRSRLAELPNQLTFRHVIGASMAAGIGFTMSIFVTNLAFTNHDDIDSSRIAILVSLVISAAVCISWFCFVVPRELKDGNVLLDH